MLAGGDQRLPGRLPPTGGWTVQCSSDQTAAVLAPVQTLHGSPPDSPRRGGSGTVAGAGVRGTRGSSNGIVMPRGCAFVAGPA